MSETPLPAADAVRLALERRFRKFGPSAAEAMVIVETALGGRDDVIARLRAACEDEERAAILGDPPPGALL